MKDNASSHYSTNEQNYTAKKRFSSPYDLWQRWDEIYQKTVTDGIEKGRRDIISMYERFPYCIKRGGKKRSEPNWGVFRTSVDDYMRFFSTLALDRGVWCRVETMEGVEEQMDSTYSDIITEAFHKFCITKWKKRNQEIINTIKDDCFFNRGHLYWKSPLDTYPCHMPTEDVFVDTNATNYVDSFDLLFVRTRLTAVELYQRCIDPAYKSMGWRSAPILRAIKMQIDSLTEMNDKDILDQFRRGGISQADQDKRIPLLYAYVKEYDVAPKDHARSGNSISLMVIPESLLSLGIRTDSEDSISSEEKKTLSSLRRKDYFMFVDYYAKDFSEIITIVSPNTKAGFYNTSSFAKQIYLGCTFHDQSLNAMIRATRRNMRLHLKAGSAESRKRFQTMDPNDEVVLFNLDDDVAQVSIRQDLSGASELLRGVRAGINEFSPVEFGGTQTSPKGYPITKGEANILSEQLDDSQANSLKAFIDRDREFVQELYRRFINSVTESDSNDSFLQFKKYLKMKGVPDKAWKEENTTVEPRFNQFGGRASSKFATSQALVQAVQIKPATPAEDKAKRSLISSIVGEANISDYLDEPMKFDSELFIIGQENTALDDPLSTPDNVPVTPSDNHMLHVQGHVADYMKKLNIGTRMLQAAAQDNTWIKPHLAIKASDVINSQDIKGGHIEAHLQMLASDESKEAELKVIIGQFKQAQAAQDQIALQAQALIQEITANGSQMNAQDAELDFKKKMYDLELQSKQANLNLDTEKKVNQIATSQQGAATKQEQKISHKEQDHSVSIRSKQEDLSVESAKKALDLAVKREEARLKMKINKDKDEKST